MMRHELSNTEDAFQLSYGEDRQRSASVASAEFGQTVITTIRIIAETENSETHIRVCARDVETHGLVGLGSAVDTLYR